MDEPTVKCRTCPAEKPLAAARHDGWRLAEDGFHATVCSGCVGTMMLDRLERPLARDLTSEDTEPGAPA